MPQTIQEQLEITKQQLDTTIQQAKSVQVVLDLQEKTISDLKAESSKKDDTISQLKAEIEQLKKPDVAPVPKPDPIKKKPVVRARATKKSETVVNWALLLDGPLNYDLEVNISHTDTETGDLQPWPWIIEKGEVMASADYGYAAGMTVEYIISHGQEYEIGTPGKEVISLGKQ